MADPAHDPTPDPVGYLEDLIHVFREGAADPAGLPLDPELCRGIADELGEILDGVEVLTALAEQVRAAYGPPPAARRTRTESLILARMAAPLDDDGRVVAFPVFSAVAAAGTDGGTAA